jgi:hypothetical protein
MKKKEGHPLFFWYRQGRVILPSLPDRVFFAHKNYGIFIITDAYSGCQITTSKSLSLAIRDANKKVSSKYPKKYGSFADYVNYFISEYGYIPFISNVKRFKTA